jgi:HEAT repeat protein
LDSDAARAALERASQDQNHRVAVNALVGLHRAGVESAAERLRNLTGHRAESFRAAAAWGLGVIEDEESVERLQGLRKDSAEIVRRNALRALVRIRKVQTATAEVSQ